MIKETYNPRTGPQVGDYVKIDDFTLPRDFTCRVARVVGKDSEGSYLVEFIESHPKLHDGNFARDKELKGKAHHCWWVGPNNMAPLKVDAMIMNDGDTIYCQRSDKRRITGTATCSKLDEYDPLTGAMIAFARAYGQDPTTAAYRVLRAFSKIPTEEPKKLRLVFGSTGNPYGELGAPTPYKDKDGVPLYVGDQVKIRTEDWEPRDLSTVVDTPEDGPFVMGLRSDCNTKTGAVKSWELTWVKSWKELKSGDKVHGGYLEVVEASAAPAPKPKKKRRVFRGGSGDKSMFYGELGADTNLVDCFGTPLHVGDVVSVLHRDRGFISDDPVVKEVDGRPFVMGLAGQQFKKDRRNTDWQIVKARPYTDLLIGEKFSDNWLEVKEEEVDE